MKFKTIKRISPIDKKYDEYASLDERGFMCTHQHPEAIGDDATIEDIKEWCCFKDIDWENYRVVEIEYFEANTVGADIRNKLSPPLNLVSLLKLYFKEEDDKKKETLKKYILKEMKNSERCVKYIAGLL